MRLFLLTALVMCAFAANSVLNRLAIVGTGIDPLIFAALRLGSGALALGLMVQHGGQGMVLRGGRRVLGALALFLYMIGFSLAYTALEAGAGALILFGGVQVTMFAGALWSGEAVPVRRWAGAAMALSGLAWLLWPQSGVGVVTLWPALSMAAAAVGWGLYSLMGRSEHDPLAATAANFILAFPAAALLALLLAAPGGGLSLWGVVLAVLSGVVASGAGYALWYRILPELGAARAAVAQLTVPVIAALAGMALLAERPGMGFLLAALLVLGGVGLSVSRKG